jgi:hypothetical protein
MSQKNMRTLIWLLIICLGSSCNSNENATSEIKDSTATVEIPGTEDKPDETNPEPVSVDGACYMQVLQRDTIVMRIEKNGNNISGRLSFDNYEKDGSTGTVRGKQEGDVLQLIYSFASEGSNSVMEVFFKEQENVLLRGVGEMQTKGDTAYFVKPEQITYPDNGRMQKINCDEVPAKYK